MRLILIRHGQTPSNLGRHLDTREPGPVLTPLGVRQAQAIPDSLGTAHVEGIWASTLIRTQLTAAPLAERLNLTTQIAPGLREISAGDLEMANDAPSGNIYLGAAMSWVNGNREVRIPGGENGHDVFARFDAAIDDIASSGIEAAAVFSHGAMIRVWAGANIGDTGPVLARQEPLSNTGAVFLSGKPGRWRLDKWHAPALGGSLLDNTERDGIAGDPAPASVQRSIPSKGPEHAAGDALTAKAKGSLRVPAPGRTT